jgi:general secretion pathway protein H
MGALTVARRSTSRTWRHQGFTLIELMLVVVIAGITLGMVSLQFRPDSHSLEAEAQRLASLMQLASDEAILRNRAILLEADSRSYQFLIRTNGTWSPIRGDDMLRARQFPHAPLALRVMPDGSAGNIRIMFDPRPIGKSFLLTMSSEQATVGIQADGLGRYVVQ